jgi:hypothetical protein
LTLALAASIATGLAGLWPNLRDRSGANDRRERVRIASALDRDVVINNWHVTRVRLDYLPGKALVEIVPPEHTNNVGECLIVAQKFGDRIDDGDWDTTACDF